MLHFNNSLHSRGNLKIVFFPHEHHFQAIYSFENYLKFIQDHDEHGILASIKNFIFFSIIYLKLSTKFNSFIFPINRNTYEFITMQNSIFVFVKDSRTFHIISRDKLSINIEIQSCNQVNIFSTYLWNHENCTKFMDSIVENSEIASKTAQSNSFHNNEKIKKMIILHNEPEMLIKDITKILDFLEMF
jgi:hypothetical protein